MLQLPPVSDGVSLLARWEGMQLPNPCLFPGFLLPLGLLFAEGWSPWESDSEMEFSV